MPRWTLPGLLLTLALPAPTHAQPSLHERIDKAIRDGSPGPFAKPASDAEFLRRVTLDLAGIPPTAAEVRAFLADPDPARRTKRIDQLLAGPDLPRRLTEGFHVMFEERRDTKDVPAAAWEVYLLRSFAARKPWHQLVREILDADPDDAATRPAARFYLERGGDAHLITRDVGRLFLGRDMECARCHDHPTVKDYTQADYFGLYAFLHRSVIERQGTKVALAEKHQPGKVDFESVFTMEKGKVGPRLPGGIEVMEPTFAKGQEYAAPPDVKKGLAGRPKYRPRAVLAAQLTAAEPGSLFVRNSANRLWFLLMGRGVVHPLDLHHRDNPPVQPKLLDVLAEGLVACQFDVRTFLREIALSEAYQRSSLLPDGKTDLPEGSFAVAELRPLSPEQLLYSIARATGAWDQAFDAAEKKLPRDDPKRHDPLWRAGVVQAAFAVPLKGTIVAFGSRPGEAETEFQPSLAGALYLANERLVLRWLTPHEGNLMARLGKLTTAEAVADELYLSILSRPPNAEERASVAAHLQRRGDRRSNGLQELAWALLASTEFRLNH